MNTKFIAFALFAVLASLFLSPLTTAEYEDLIFDNGGILTSKISEIEQTIKMFEDRTGVKIRIYTDDLVYGDYDDIDTVANNAYKWEVLDIGGKPAYNILLYYAKTYEKGKLAYVHSRSCEDFVEFTDELKKGKISEDKIAEDILDKVNLIIAKIKELKDAYGEECEKASEQEAGIEVVKENSIYLIDNENLENGGWKDILSLYPLTTYHVVPAKYLKSQLDDDQKMTLRKGKVIYNPTLVYHKEGENLDLDSIMIYLDQLIGPNPEDFNLYIVNNAPTKLNLALQKYGALQKFSFKEIAILLSRDYPRLWGKKRGGYDSVVLSEDDYATGLLASHFASYTNSPLVFSADDLKNYYYEKLYCIGNVKHSDCDKKYSFVNIEGVQKFLRKTTKTDKVILVNPIDIEDGSCEQIPWETQFGKLEKSHCGDSIISPLLASVKNELIVPIENEPLDVGMLRGIMPPDSNKFYVDKDENYYFQTSNSIEKYNFEKQEVEWVLKLDEKNYISFISPEGKTYIAMRSTGDIFEIKGDRSEKICSLGKDSMLVDSHIELPLDFAVDDEGNMYFVGNNYDYSYGVSAKLAVFDKNCQQIYDDIIFDVGRLEQRLDEFFKEYAPYKEFHLTLKEIYYKEIKISFKPDGIYFILLFSSNLELGENNEQDNYVIVVYKYDKEKHDQEWFENEDDYKKTYRIYTNYKRKPKNMQIGESGNLYFLSGQNLVEVPDNLESVESRDLLPSIGSMGAMSSNDGKIYLLYNDVVIAVFDEDKLISGDKKTPEKLINPLVECYSYKLGANKEKETFENSINMKQNYIKTTFDKKLGEIGGEYKYLTVIASPRSIPISSYFGCSLGDYYGGNEIRMPFDSKIIEGDATGRIFGITVSDASSYFNRIASFSEGDEAFVPSDGKTREFEKIGIVAYDFGKYQEYILELRKQLSEKYEVECSVGYIPFIGKGCDWNIYTSSLRYFKDKDIFIYDDHGKVNSLLAVPVDWRLDNISSTIGVTQACSTGDYYASYVQTKKPNLFASNFMRMGGLGYIGAPSLTLRSDIVKVLASKLMSGYDLGNTLESTVNDPNIKKTLEYFGSIYSIKDLAPNHMLFGDPTIKPALKKKIKLHFDVVESEKRHECEMEGDVKVCNRRAAVKTAKVKMCGKVRSMKVESIVYKGQYGAPDTEEADVYNPLLSFWKSLSDKQQSNMMKNLESHNIKYTKLRLNVLTEDDKSLAGGEYDYEDGLNLAAQDPVYCWCLNNIDQCRKKYDKEIEDKKPTSTPPPEPVEEPKKEEPKKESVHICTGKIGDIKCECRTCDNPKPIKNINGQVWGVSCERENLNIRFTKQASVWHPGYEILKGPKGYKDDYLCIVECSEDNTCSSKNVEFDAYPIFEELGFKDE
ncbi:MAG: TPM domain-containing protein [Candidatus Peribacteraceae bacterium]|nr:TPM domain-containing protein [Candidatus Peribacteraceae bacterium]